MNLTYYSGTRVDVSWALVQRNAKDFISRQLRWVLHSDEADTSLGSNGAFPNRVIHPPPAPVSHDISTDNCVVMEGLVSDLLLSDSVKR